MACNLGGRGRGKMTKSSPIHKPSSRFVISPLLLPASASLRGSEAPLHRVGPAEWTWCLLAARLSAGCRCKRSRTRWRDPWFVPLLVLGLPTWFAEQRVYCGQTYQSLLCSEIQVSVSQLKTRSSYLEGYSSSRKISYCWLTNQQAEQTKL